MTKIFIKLPRQFRGYVGGAESLTVDAGTVGRALAVLGARSPALGERLMTPKGGLRRFVNLYRGEDDIRYLQGLDTPLKDGDVVQIIVAMAGG